MTRSNQTDEVPHHGAPVIPHSGPAGGTASLEAAMGREKNPVKRFFKLLGPGLITGASDDDPSGIGTYAVAGAAFGFATLWTALFTFVGAAFFARPDWLAVIKATFIPRLSFDAAFLATLVAIFGTTISPYLFFWQADQEVEEEISFGRVTRAQRRGASDAEIKYARWDVHIGMFLSNLVMYFIILATAATLFKTGQTNIQSATDAAEALKPFAHGAASLLLAVGLIGSGFLAVPVLTGCSAYALTESFGGRYGFYQKLRRAKFFYAVIIVSTLVGVLINFIGINPIRALLLAAIINGFLAPPLLVAIMLVANNRHIMGNRVNGRWSNILGWTTTVVMFVAAVALVLTWGH